MNIEEAHLPRAIESANGDLFLFHAADSNRQAVGRGHTDFRTIADALRAIRYHGDVVFECVAPGPDPFAPLKGPDSRAQIERFLRESLARMKDYAKDCGS
jgi:D-psicose/D-tagatose/L-ribulose 3-epimerase